MYCCQFCFWYIEISKPYYSWINLFRFDLITYSYNRHERKNKIWWLKNCLPEDRPPTNSTPENFPLEYRPQYIARFSPPEICLQDDWPPENFLLTNSTWKISSSKVVNIDNCPLKTCCFFQIHPSLNSSRSFYKFEIPERNCSQYFFNSLLQP